MEPIRMVFGLGKVNVVLEWAQDRVWFPDLLIDLMLWTAAKELEFFPEDDLMTTHRLRPVQGPMTIYNVIYAHKISIIFEIA